MSAPNSRKKWGWIAGAAVVLIVAFWGLYALISRNLAARDKRLAPSQQAGTPADEALRKARAADVQRTLEEIRRMNAVNGRPPTTLGDPTHQSVQRTLDEINRLNQMNLELRNAQRNPAPPPQNQKQ